MCFRDAVFTVLRIHLEEGHLLGNTYVIDFLIWKDNFGKTVVHIDTCPLFGEKSVHWQIESYIYLISMGDQKLIISSLGSPTPQLHHWLSYFSAVREEQLVARVM